jgi:Plavaka transposase
VDGLYPEPPPPEKKTADDWRPFDSQDHFEIAEFLYCKARMSAGNTDTLMKLLARMQRDQNLFKNHDEMCETIDATELGGVPWQRSTLRYQCAVPVDDPPQWMSTEYEIFYRDPHKVLKNMLADPTFEHGFDYAPYQKFDNSGDRIYENVMSGDWAFRQAVSQLNNGHGYNSADEQ